MDVEKSFRAAKSLNDKQVRLINDLEDAFVDFAGDINNLPDSREKSLAITKLQEAKFWTIECVAKIVN